MTRVCKVRVNVASPTKQTDLVRCCLWARVRISAWNMNRTTGILVRDLFLSPTNLKDAIGCSSKVRCIALWNSPAAALYMCCRWWTCWHWRVLLPLRALSLRHCFLIQLYKHQSCDTGWLERWRTARLGRSTILSYETTPFVKLQFRLYSSLLTKYASLSVKCWTVCQE